MTAEDKYIDNLANEHHKETLGKEQLHFNIDVPKLILEISNNHGMWALNIPLKILQKKLSLIAKRATELNDPELNILMLETKLYEVKHSQIQDLIKLEKLKIK